MNTDPTCPLRFDPGHVCRNRDRHISDPEPLREGSTCYMGAVRALELEGMRRCAEQAAFTLADAAAKVIGAINFYCLRDEVDDELTALADAVLDWQLKAQIAGIRPRPVS